MLRAWHPCWLGGTVMLSGSSTGILSSKALDRTFIWGGRPGPLFMGAGIGTSKSASSSSNRGNCCLLCLRLSTGPLWSMPLILTSALRRRPEVILSGSGSNPTVATCRGQSRSVPQSRFNIHAIIQRGICCCQRFLHPGRIASSGVRAPQQ